MARPKNINKITVRMKTRWYLISSKPCQDNQQCLRITAIAQISKNS
ncbi:hypothetical protein MtrunA17_Chr5g0418361 [Medicago truncatula]|uniref:Uncharacterized protein n=1 Tax=Medicago truncatula TaxID=3880 RepID=A0A396HQ73_MEDTR|nr:hypothetical protein MtrunA17_Chr5g0418361 [Medicago truncatula]